MGGRSKCYGLIATSLHNMRRIEAGVTDPSWHPRLVVCRQSWRVRILGRPSHMLQSIEAGTVLASCIQLVAAGAASGLCLPATQRVDDEGECYQR